MTELKATTEHPGSSGIPKGFMTFGVHAATRPDPDKTRAFDNMFDTDSKGRCVLRMESGTLRAHLKRNMDQVREAWRAHDAAIRNGPVEILNSLRRQLRPDSLLAIHLWRAHDAAIRNGPVEILNSLRRQLLHGQPDFHTRASSRQVMFRSDTGPERYWADFTPDRETRAAVMNFLKSLNPCHPCWHEFTAGASVYVRVPEPTDCNCDPRNGEVMEITMPKTATVKLDSDGIPYIVKVTGDRARTPLSETVAESGDAIIGTQRYERYEPFSGRVSEITPDRIRDILQGGGNFQYEAVPGDTRAEIRLEPN